MFEGLQTKLGSVFDKLKGKGSLSAKDIDVTTVEIRRVLLDADVALPVVRTFIERVKQQAVQESVLKSVTPGQQVVKVVHDVMVDIFNGGESPPTDKNATDTKLDTKLDTKNFAGALNLRGEPPVAIMMVGLQGAGKTTSSGKIAGILQNKNRKKVLMASLDVARPAAQQQLAVLGDQVGVDTLPIIAGQSPVDITKRAMQAGKFGGYDVVILDTAGRLSIDAPLMFELSQISAVAKPQETLLVADAMTGQDSVTTAENFHQRLPLSGIVLTRVDGDSRGGAALSMRHTTGCPIKFMGVGEKLDDIELFDADRIANRILGMGDIVALVEKAQETASEQDMEKMAARMMSGKFDLNDLRSQLQQMQKMGGLGSLMGMLPGVGKMKNKMESAGINDNMLGRQIAIINSMTNKERINPKILHASRKRRIASGSGTSVPEINKLLKQFQTMEKTMKHMRKMGGKMPPMPGGMPSGMGGMGSPFGGGNPLGGNKPGGGFSFGR